MNDRIGSKSPDSQFLSVYFVNIICVMYNLPYNYTKKDKLPVLIKGALYDTAPVTICLTTFIILHNLLISLHYWREKSKLVQGLFVKLAISDIFSSTGKFSLAVMSVILYKTQGLAGYHDIHGPLIYIVMIITATGISAAKICNLALT